MTDYLYLALACLALGIALDRIAIRITHALGITRRRRLNSTRVVNLAVARLERDRFDARKKQRFPVVPS